SLVCGDSDSSQTVAVVVVVAEPQHFRARVVMIAEMARDRLDLHVRQTGGVQNSPRGRIAAHDRGNLRRAGISRADPHLRDDGQNECRREKQEILEVTWEKKWRVHKCYSPRCSRNWLGTSD